MLSLGNGGQAEIQLVEPLESIRSDEPQLKQRPQQHPLKNVFRIAQTTI